MLAETTLARPYARAAFDLAEKSAALEPWRNALSAAAEVVATESASRILGNPKIDAEQIIALFGDALGGHMTDTFKNFLNVLMHYRRLPLLPEIYAQFEILRRASEQRLKVHVTSAIELDAGQREKLAARLKQRFGAEVDMETDVDAELIGGLVVRAGDRVIDSSLRGRLEQLGRQLVR
ncbi:MAG: F0F1 ATP synthase subunit delta [Pseudomonadota bacterium]